MVLPKVKAECAPSRVLPPGEVEKTRSSDAFERVVAGLRVSGMPIAASGDPRHHPVVQDGGVVITLVSLTMVVDVADQIGTAIDAALTIDKPNGDGRFG